MGFPRYQLFLGFLVDDSYQKELDLLDEKLLALFVREGSCYLQRVVYKGSVYLGKYLGERSDLQTLHSIEKNIYSLIGKLTPSYSATGHSLRLFPAKINDR